MKKLQKKLIRPKEFVDVLFRKLHKIGTCNVCKIS